MIDQKKLRNHALKLVMNAEELAHKIVAPQPVASNNNNKPHGLYSVSEYMDYVNYANDPSRWNDRRS